MEAELLRGYEECVDVNILIVNGNYEGGGASRVAKDIYEGLLKRGHNVYFLVARDATNRYDNVIYTSMIRILAHRIKTELLGKVCYRNKYAKKKIIEFVQKNSIEVIHFHNITNNYFGFEDLRDLTKYCKVVWTLHELWSVTGHCFHPCQCGKWIDEECVNCEYPSRDGKINRNISQKIYNRKKKAFVDSGIIYAVPSTWMKSNIEKSFLKYENVHVVHNGIDLEFINVYDKKEVRDKYKIDLEKKVLLFMAADLNNSGKGFDKLVASLKYISNLEKIVLVTIGNGVVPLEISQKIEMIELGYLVDKNEINEIMSLADITVIPSVAESFSLVAAESMAAGTPVVCFESGGIQDVVNESVGWVVENGNVSELGKTIEMALECDTKYKMKRDNCRSWIENNFSLHNMLENYEKIYKDLRN